jgi:hypothetical protein
MHASTYVINLVMCVAGLGSKQKFDSNAREEDPSDENALKAAEVRRVQLEEMKRQKKLCEEMAKEEA